ncbi:MAG TPA: methyl-accepting chemotaxis protein [Burkholderiaceae bacterium]|nr:methyl-accepting chemotaxis protein [Burkholderiaceae bacterium]
MKKLMHGVRNMRVRTSFILILSIFFFMLVFGAVLGVGALYLNGQATSRLVASQQAQAELVNALSRYKDTQLTLERAVTSQLVDAGLNDRAANLQVLARGQYDEAVAAFNHYQQRVDALGTTSAIHDRVSNAFQSALNGGLSPLVGLVENNDSGTYQSYLEGTTLYLEEELLESVAALAQDQQHIIDSIHADEATQFRMVVGLVAFGITASLLVCLVAYLFLMAVVLKPLRRAGGVFDRIASGDLTQTIEATNHNEIGQLFAAVQRMQHSLVQVVSEVRAGVLAISTGADEIYRGNTDLSSRTEQQAASLQQTAASMEQLDGTVRQNTDNATQADQLAQGASQVAERGGAAVGAVVDSMHEITARSEKIANIISTIDGIAFQTNILALNAAVEAARAGEQGRGFAVVAGEVRSLAQRSAQAAREISELIDASTQTIEQGQGRAAEAGDIMQDVVSAIGQVATIMSEISLASHEQADGIGQVNTAVGEMDSVVQQNAALVEQAAAAAGSLQEQAQRLEAAVGAFRLQVDPASVRPVSANHLPAGRDGSATRIDSPAARALALPRT